MATIRDTMMDESTMKHFTIWVQRAIHPDYVDDFVAFALDILVDPEQLQFYINEGWPKLRNRFYRENM